MPDKAKKYIIALDQGTTSSRAIVFDAQQHIIAQAQRDLRQIYPRPGYVEHDPLEIYSTQYSVMTEAIARSGILPEEIAAIGITNQRETAIVWEKDTGKPICNAIVWQCRRTAPLCEQLTARGLQPMIRQKTGLVIDAYFSATKLAWILDHVEGARARAERGELLFGTVDSYLLYRLTGGEVHATDPTNASRTMLFNIRTLRWDEEICAELKIPMKMLPKVLPSSSVFGTTNLGGCEVPVAAMAGDQQAALFGQACFEKGSCKNTYGTGCFLLMNTGSEIRSQNDGLLATVAAYVGDRPQYALEGSVFVGGAVIQWLRDELKLIADASEVGKISASLPDNGGVYIVPAFTGLGAPYWDMYARGCIVGLTRGVNRAHFARAVLESITYQVNDLVEAMTKDSGILMSEMRVDGGASVSNIMLQLQSNMTGTKVNRPKLIETTALGAAYMAGLAVGFWKDLDEIETVREVDRIFVPAIDADTRTQMLKGWHKAVERSKNWEEH